MEQLVRRQPQHDPRRRVERIERLVAVRDQRAVELDLPAQGAVRQLGRQRRLARLEHAGLAKRRIERQVGESAVLFDAEEDLGSDAARGRGHRRGLYHLILAGVARYCAGHEAFDPESALERQP